MKTHDVVPVRLVDAKQRRFSLIISRRERNKSTQTVQASMTISNENPAELIYIYIHTGALGFLKGSQVIARLDHAHTMQNPKDPVFFPFGLLLDVTLELHGLKQLVSD